MLPGWETACDRAGVKLPGLSVGVVLLLCVLVRLQLIAEPSCLGKPAALWPL